MKKEDKSGQKTANRMSKNERKILRNILNDSVNEVMRCDDAASRDHWRQAQTIAQLDNFGLGMLNIQEAAELIACDMWAEDKIEFKALDDFDGHLFAPEVKDALAKVISDFATKLTRAIDAGRLQPAHVARDFDENLILTETFIEISQLEEWLNERGYYIGEAFRDWCLDETEICDRMINELIWLRSVAGNARGRPLPINLKFSHHQIDESNKSDLIAAYKSANLENQHLRERLANTESRLMEKPVSEKHRNTLLTLIGALCEAADLDLKKKGVSQRIKEMTEQIGAPVDDETIRKIIAAVPDAIERRSR